MHAYKVTTNISDNDDEDEYDKEFEMMQQQKKQPMIIAKNQINMAGGNN